MNNSSTVHVVWCDRRKRGCFRWGEFWHNAILCNEGHVADVKAKTINPNHEALPMLQTKKKIARTLMAVNESADVT